MKGYLFTWMLIFFWLPNALTAQCTCNEDDCGPLVAALKILNDENVVCDGTEFFVQNLTDTPADFYVWDWGDGSVDTTYNTADISHVYSIPDSLVCTDDKSNFPICLTAFIECGNRISCNSVQQVISVIHRPKARIELPVRVCLGEAVSLGNQSCNASDFLWDFGNGRTSTSETPDLLFDAPGFYEVSLTAGNRCQNDKVRKQIEVVGPPVADVEPTVDPMTFCTNLSLILDNRSRNVDSYTWHFPAQTEAWRFLDTTYTRDSFDNALFFTQPGDFELSLDVTNVCGTDTWEYPLSVFEAPTVKLEKPGTFCEQGFVNFRDYVSYTGSVFGQGWTFEDAQGNIRESDEAFPQVNFTTPGAHEITVVVDGGPCGESSKSTTLFIQVPGEINFLPPDVPLCTEADTIRLVAVPPGGDWSGSRAVTSDGIFDPALAGGGEHTLTYSIGEGACTAMNTLTLEVRENPAVSLAEPDAACDALSFTPEATIRGDYSLLRWAFRMADGTTRTFNQEEPPTVEFVEPGRHSFWVEVEGACGRVADTVEIEIQQLDPIAIIEPVAPYCTDTAPDTLRASPAGGTWSGTGVSRDGIFNPSIARKGIHTLTYSIGAEACRAAASITVEVLERPFVDLPQREVACERLEYTPEANIRGDYSAIRWSYQLADGRSERFEQDAPPTVVFSTPGQHLFWVELESPCGLITDTTRIDIQTIDPIMIDEPVGPYCPSDAPQQITALPSGGAWSGPGISRDGLFDPGTVERGVAITLTYTYGDGICQNEASIDVEVLEAPAISVTADVTLCVDHGNYALEFEPAGGEWSGSGIINPTAGTVDPELAGPGIHALVYTFSAEEGCNASATTEVRIEAVPDFEVEEATVLFCETSEDIDLLNSVSLLTSPPGGLVTWSGPGIVDPGGRFNSLKAGASGKGIYQVFARYTRNDCQVVDSLFIEITEVQAVFAGEDTTVCVNEQFFSLTGTPVGGRWSGPGVDPLSGTIDLMDAGGGEHNYRYVFAEGSTCQVEDAVQMEIIDLSGVDAGRDFSVCEGASALDLNEFSPAGGTWSGPGIVDEKSGRFDPGLLIPGSDYVLTYCVESAAVDCSSCDEIRIAVTPLPVAEFNILGTTCIGETIVLENTSTGACSYFWDFGDGYTSNSPAPRHAYDQAGTYTLTLITSSCEDCESSYSREVTVTTPPTAAFEMDRQEGCAVLDVTFANESRGSDLSYQWDFGNGNASVRQNPGKVFFDQGINDTVYQVKLAVSNACGTVYHNDSIKVFPLPVARLGTDIDDGCSPLEVRLANGTGGNPDAFFWDLGNGITSRDSVPDLRPVYTTSDSTVTSYFISLIAENQCGRDTMKKEIVVHPPDVEAFLSVDTTRGCQPLSVSYASFSTPGAAISWDFGDGNGASSVEGIHTFTSPGTFMVRQFASGCGTDSDSVLIEVLPAPDVSFSHEPRICAGQPLELLNESTGISGSLWQFGDGASALLQSPVHEYDSAGIYTIMLTAYSQLNNCPTSVTSEVEVLGIPEASFLPSLTEGCAPLRVDFETTNSGVAAYIWNFDDGALGNGPAPSHTFEQAGTYQVRLTASDNFGCFSDSSLLDIIVHPLPETDFETDRNAFCSGVDSIHFTNRTKGAAAYVWDFGGGNSSVLESPTIVLQDTGNTRIVLLAETAFGCRASASTDLQILGTPIAAFTPGKREGCSPFSLAFSNTSQYADQFFWDFGDGNSSGTKMPVNIFKETGTYDVEMIASNSNTCPADTANIMIRVHPVPESGFTISDSLVCGLPHTITTANTSQGAIDYTWEFGNGVGATASAPEIVYSEPGDFSISLVAANIYGCRDTSFRQVSMNHQPLADFDPMDYQGCESDTISFQSLSLHADSWQWDFGDGHHANSENPFHRYAAEGNYAVELIVGFNERCFDTLRMEQAISLLPGPKAAFTWTDETDGFIQFNNYSEGAIQYEWNFGDASGSNHIAPRHEYANNGEWEVALSAIAANGCRDRVTDLIRPELFFGLYLPNAMSPESGVGDVRLFKPTGLGIQNYLIQVFSPWGQLVWESDLVEGEQPGESWDGTYQGKVVQQGAYVWKANVSFINGVKQVKTGTVTVIR